MIQHTTYLLLKIFCHFLQNFSLYSLGFPVTYYIHVTSQEKFDRFIKRVYQRDEVALYQSPDDGPFSDTQHDIGRLKGNAYCK